MDLIFVVIIIGLLAVFVLLLKRKSKKTITELPYDSQGGLLTPAERSLFGVLNQVVGEEAEIFAKVRLADVVTPKKGMSRSEWQKAFNKISAKHVDFLLCKRNDLSFVCVIELDDKSHKKVYRQQRDELLGGICEAAGIPLVRIPAKSTYVLDEVRLVVNDALGSETTHHALDPVAPETERSIQHNEQSIAPQNAEELCPKCTSPLVRRIAKSGKHAGKQFLGCSKYPKCYYIQEIEA